MTLRYLFRAAGVRSPQFHGDAELQGIEIDSRRVKAGDLFVAMPSEGRSEAFLGAAVQAGATAAMVSTSDAYEAATRLGIAVAYLEEPYWPDALWRLCDALLDHPTRHMKVVGVTGTNGKTTTAWVVRDMLRVLGKRAAYLGTLGFQLPGQERELANTTPVAVELYNLLAEARSAGVDALAMEVSSHALAERRVDGVEFDVGVFTNLTQDHLDFHRTMEEYAAAKKRLFTDLPAESKKRFVSVLNADDPVGREWSSEFPVPTRMFGSHLGERALSLAFVPEHMAVDHITGALGDYLPGQPWEPRWVGRIGLGGSYNVQNAAAAAAAVRALGYGFHETGMALSQARPVPGRFEPVANNRGIGVLVDYAHTPDALEKLLDAVRPLSSGRVITVFGCGGDRDRSKRPKMAAAASQRSDVTVVTSDNPRTEDPEAILREVAGGILPGRESVAIVDRAEAVAHAVRIARPGDVVVIAGKGHENYQIIGKTKHPMDDRELARAAF